MAKKFSKNKIAEHYDPIINNDTMTNNDIQFRKLHHKTRLSFLPQKNEKQQQQQLQQLLLNFLPITVLLMQLALKNKIYSTNPFLSLLVNMANCGHFTATKLATTGTYFATSGKLTIISNGRLLISFRNEIVTFLGCRITIFH